MVVRWYSAGWWWYSVLEVGEWSKRGRWLVRGDCVFVWSEFGVRVRGVRERWGMLFKQGWRNEQIFGDFSDSVGVEKPGRTREEMRDIDEGLTQSKNPQYTPIPLDSSKYSRWLILIAGIHWLIAQSSSTPRKSVQQRWFADEFYPTTWNRSLHVIAKHNMRSIVSSQTLSTLTL
jgi:hypothetical protein